MMKCPFDTTLNSILGHCIPLKANVPTWIPPEIVEMARERGCVNSDAPATVVTTKEQPAEVVAPDETDDNEVLFTVELDKALLKIITRNDESDFKKDLTPKVARVIAEMDPSFRRATATEVSNAFEKLQENIDLTSE
jgi:hypothetical protein